MKKTLILLPAIFLVAAGCNYNSNNSADYSKNPPTTNVGNQTPVKPEPGDDKFCAQVITKARNTQTGEEKEFPNSCLPDGWEAIQPNVTQ